MNSPPDNLSDEYLEGLIATAIQRSLVEIGCDPEVVAKAILIAINAKVIRAKEEILRCMNPHALNDEAIDRLISEGLKQ